MKLQILRGKRFGWLFICTILLLVWCGVAEQRALAQLFQTEYIRVQPTSDIRREGMGASFDIGFGYGTGALDAETVYWYRNGVLVGSTVPKLETYDIISPKPKQWNPYARPRGTLYPDDPGSLPAASDERTNDSRAYWTATFSIPVVTVQDAGMYYARVRVGKPNSKGVMWAYTNLAQLVVVSADPAKSMEVVRHPGSKSLTSPVSEPVPGMRIYGDMRSHVSPSFNSPYGAATDAEGFTFLADTLNHCIRRVSPGGHTTTLAGMDGQPTEAVELSEADALSRSAVTTKQRVPVADHKDGITDQTSVDSYRNYGSLSTAAFNEPKFDSPEGLTISDLGIVYVADTGNNAIRGIRTEGGVTTVFTVYGQRGSELLKSPRGIAFSGSSSDPVNNPPVLYVLDSGNYTIKKLFLSETTGFLDPSVRVDDGVTVTDGCRVIAGLGSTPGWQGSTVAAGDARFYSPRGLVHTTDPETKSETIFVADTVNHVIRQITKFNGVWTARTVVGFVGSKGNVNGVGSAARLNFPVGLALDEANQLLYFTEFGSHSLRRVNLPYNSRQLPAWTVDLVAGSGYYGPTLMGPNGSQGSGNGDGTGTAAVFYYPAAISFNKFDGSILLADSNNNVLRKVTIDTNGTWMGTSVALAGTVGAPGNRDFSELNEFTYQWKKDGLLIKDGTALNGRTIAGALSDTLSLSGMQYEDAGVYALIVTNFFEQKLETDQSFVYLATEGAPPRFLDPGYRVESLKVPGDPASGFQPVSEFNKDMSVFISADVLPADQLTYQWQVAEDVGSNGPYTWISLTDSPIGIQAKDNVSLGRLLGTSMTTITGSATPRLAITRLQASVDGPLPRLRFRVDASTRAVPPVQLDPKVQRVTATASWSVSPAQTILVTGTVTGLKPLMTVTGEGIAGGTKIKSIDGGTLTLDTPALASSTGTPTLAAFYPEVVPLETITFTGTWTAVPEQTVVVSGSGFSKGMYVSSGTAIAAGTRIKAVTGGTLTLDTPATTSGNGVLLLGFDDLDAGVLLPTRYPAAFGNPNLAVLLGSGGTVKTDQFVDVGLGQTVTLGAVAGGEVVGNPAPSYQWYRRKIPSDDTGGNLGEFLDPELLVGATDETLTLGSVTEDDRGLYYLSVENGVGAPAQSKGVFLNVERPATLTIRSMLGDGEVFTLVNQNPLERIMDKTKAKGLVLAVNVDASVMPIYEWRFVPDDPSSDTVDLDAFQKEITDPETNETTLNLVTDGKGTSGSLSIADYPYDGDGTFTLTVRLPGDTVQPRTCSWHVGVQDLPRYIPNNGRPSKFLAGLVGQGGTYSVNLDNQSVVSMGARFSSPRNLPLSYRWRRDNELLSGGTILPGGTISLTLTSITKANLGTYRLEVTNKMGTLVIGAVEPELPFTERVPSTSASNTFVSVPVSGWLLKDSGMPYRPVEVTSPTGRGLVPSFANASFALAGMLAAAPRAAAAPSFGTVPGTSLRVAKSQRLVLQVLMEAEPPPTYQWYRYPTGGSREAAVALANANSAIYVLPPVTDPEGSKWKYFAKATNIRGVTSSAEIEVRVEKMPDPTVQIADATSVPILGGAVTSVGSGVNLRSVVTDLEAPYTYQWKFNGSPILGATSKELRFSAIGAGQAGSYSVVVTGVAGSKESSGFKIVLRSAANSKKYRVSFENVEELIMLSLSPAQPPEGFAAGTKVTITGSPPSNKMLQGWEFSTSSNSEDVRVLPARAAQFIMPDEGVTVKPRLSRYHSGTYVGLLSLEAPWMPDDEWAAQEGKENDFFRPRYLKPDLGKIRGLFRATVGSFGTVSGQIQIENRTLGFSTVLDSEMNGNFRISTTLRGVPWNMTGTIKFNTTPLNRKSDYMDNVAHVVLRDVLLSTPPLLQVGQTLYASAAGVTGAASALKSDISEALLNGETTNGGAAAAPAAPSVSSGTVAPALPSGAAAASPDVKIFLSVNPRSPTVNQSVSFFATVIVIPFQQGVIQYQWYKDYRRLPNSDRIVGADTRSMLLRAPLLDSDFGDYWLVVTLPDGTRFTSGDFTLTKSSTVPGGGSTNPGLPSSAPMYFTGAMYRESSNGETKETSFGQAGVLSTQVTPSTGSVLVRGYMANGARVTYSTYLGWPFITAETEPPEGISIDPEVSVASPFRPTPISSLSPTGKQLSGRAREVLDELILRRTTSQSLALWFRGDTATEPVFGAMVFNGPKVYGALGALGLDTASKRSEYTANLFTGYYYDPLLPYVTNLPTGQPTDQNTATLTTPDAHPGGLKVSFISPTVPQPNDDVQIAMDPQTGLTFGGLNESTSKYVRANPPYSPRFAASKTVLACTAAGVVIQKSEIIPGLSWNSNMMGGHVGFIYRSRNGSLEPLRNILGRGAPEEATLSGRTIGRIEAFRIDFADQF